MKVLNIAVFTDLDGTLLDHSSYSHAAAAPALERLRRESIPVVLCSSKTAAEIRVLQEELGLSHCPAIVENGAGVIMKGMQPEQATDYEAIREQLDALPERLRREFRGFGDMSDGEVAELTGLSHEAATRARQRQFSEPGLWSGSDSEMSAFLECLKEAGIQATQGGRFLTLSFGRNKADGMREVAETLGLSSTIALGDAPNDIDMLQSATRGVIIRNDHGPDLPVLEGEAEGRIFRTEKPGPEGWNNAVLHLLETMGHED